MKVDHGKEKLGPDYLKCSCEGNEAGRRSVGAWVTNPEKCMETSEFSQGCSLPHNTTIL